MTEIHNKNERKKREKKRKTVLVQESSEKYFKIITFTILLIINKKVFKRPKNIFDTLPSLRMTGPVI